MTANRPFWAQLAAFCDDVNRKWPFIAAGDWNMLPEQMDSFTKLVKGFCVCTADGTFQCSSGKFSKLDYFIVDDRLQGHVRDISQVEMGGLAPQRRAAG